MEETESNESVNTAPNNIEHARTNISKIIFAATDGACTANGKANAAASWAYTILMPHFGNLLPNSDISTNGNSSPHVDSSPHAAFINIIPTISDVKGKPTDPIGNYGFVDRAGRVDGLQTNQRGELMALMRVFEALLTDNIRKDRDVSSADGIVIFSDSQYSIKCIDEWSRGWADGCDKKNLDLIVPARTLLDKLRLMCPVKLVHVRGHKKMPARDTPEDIAAWFTWYLNHRVDLLCTALLR